MLYIRKQFEDGAVLNVRINEEDLYTECPDCGADVSVADENLLMAFVEHGFDAAICCDECSAKRQAKREEK